MQPVSPRNFFKNFLNRYYLSVEYKSSSGNNDDNNNTNDNDDVYNNNKKLNSHFQEIMDCL